MCIVIELSTRNKEKISGVRNLNEKEENHGAAVKRIPELARPFTSRTAHFVFPAAQALAKSVQAPAHEFSSLPHYL